MKIKGSQREYPIEFLTPQEIAARIPEDAFIFTDHNVAKEWSSVLGSRPRLILPPGEGNKSLAVFGECQRALAKARASRKTTVVAFGGGVIGDLAGFVAATYMRGVPFLQIPTTVLSQVDSSVGGKVAIDTPDGKNLVGAFYPPHAVYVSVELLRTLPKRQFVNGMAEVWKYGFIMDPELLTVLDAGTQTLDDLHLTQIIDRCIALKAQVVEEDEFETTGRRAILNYGHTIGHAIELLTGYGPILHGEAISIGMVVEAELGVRLGITPPYVTNEVRLRLEHQGLPVSDPILHHVDDMVDAMRSDKKAEAGNFAFSLLTDVGGCKLEQNVSEREIRAALEAS